MDWNNNAFGCYNIVAAAMENLGQVPTGKTVMAVVVVVQSILFSAQPTEDWWLGVSSRSCDLWHDTIP